MNDSVITRDYDRGMLDVSIEVDQLRYKLMCNGFLHYHLINVKKEYN